MAWHLKSMLHCSSVLFSRLRIVAQCTHTTRRAHCAVLTGHATAPARRTAGAGGQAGRRTLRRCRSRLVWASSHRRRHCPPGYMQTGEPDSTGQRTSATALRLSVESDLEEQRRKKSVSTLKKELLCYNIIPCDARLAPLNTCHINTPCVF